MVAKATPSAFATVLHPRDSLTWEHKRRAPSRGVPSPLAALLASAIESPTGPRTERSRLGLRERSSVGRRATDDLVTTSTCDRPIRLADLRDGATESEVHLMPMDTQVDEAPCTVRPGRGLGHDAARRRARRPAAGAVDRDPTDLAAVDDAATALLHGRTRTAKPPQDRCSVAAVIGDDRRQFDGHASD